MVYSTKTIGSGPSAGFWCLLLAAVLLTGCRSSTDPTARTETAGPSPGGKSKGIPSITANPNPVPAGAEKFGKTTISWDTGDGKPGEVYVSVNGAEEKRFSGAKANGSQEAAWIGKGEYEFRLYAGKEHTIRLASVKVTRTQ